MRPRGCKLLFARPLVFAVGFSLLCSLVLIAGIWRRREPPSSLSPASVSSAAPTSSSSADPPSRAAETSFQQADREGFRDGSVLLGHSSLGHHLQSHSLPPTVLILTPIKNAVKYVTRILRLLEGLSYPASRISLGLMDSDSTDEPTEAQKEAVARLAASRAIDFDVGSDDWHHSGTLYTLLAAVPTLQARYRRVRIFQRASEPPKSARQRRADRRQRIFLCFCGCLAAGLAKSPRIHLLTACPPARAHHLAGRRQFWARRAP